MTKKQAEVADVATIAELRQQAALAPTLEQKAALIAQAERMESERMLVTSAERALDLTVHEAVEIIPHGTHEMHSEQTDWLMATAAQSKGDANDATQALVAEAAMWFDRVPEFVKVEPNEFRIQAQAKARREASQWGEHAPAAAQAFLDETDRLHRMAVKGGLQTVAALIPDRPDWADPDPRSAPLAPGTSRAERELVNGSEDRNQGRQQWGGGWANPERSVNQGVHPSDSRYVHDLENGGMVRMPPAPGPQVDQPAQPEPKGNPVGAKPQRDNIKHQPAPDFTPGPVNGHLPHIHHEIDRVLRGDDTAGVREMAEGYASHQVRAAGLSAIAKLRGETQDSIDLGAILAGFDVTAAGGEMGVAEEALGMSGGAGRQENPIGAGINSVQNALDSSSNGVRDASNSEVSRELNTAAASTVPQVGSQGPGGTGGLPTQQFSTFSGDPGDQNTDSNRAPALQEIQDFTGWDGTSVVPSGDSGAAGSNADHEGLQDATDTPLASTYASRQPQYWVPDAQQMDQFNQHLNAALAADFASLQTTASKEHSMTEHAQCPTCGGHGKVAVRKQAYSGLPQIQQIVNADESPGATPLPQDVAFPLDPNWGNGGNVQNAINETEQQLSERAGKSPLLKGSQLQGYDQDGRPASHVANGRDNSGWLGDNGAQGLDYPGYSAPTGYDGSNNLGEPDPVYGYGGDNGNQPQKPYGAEEANDVTNNPPVTNFDYSGPNDAGQGYRSVGPGMNTQGSRDPFVAAAQEEIQRQQAIIAARVRG